MAIKQKMVNGKKYRLVNNKWVQDHSWGKVNKSSTPKRKKTLTRTQQREAEKKERKTRWEKHQKELEKRGQDQMTLKQRQADDDIKRRKKLIKGKKKVRWFGRLSKEEKKKIAQMERRAHKRHGTNKHKLKAAKQKSRDNQRDFYTM